MENREIEVRFLNIDKAGLVKTLRALGAIETPESLLKETIFYDPDLKWRDIDHRVVRIRKTGDIAVMTYKHRHNKEIGGTEEIEFEVSNTAQAQLFLERLGLIAFREQEKKRHTWKLDGAMIDIDEWPTVPPYVELEGSSEEHLKEVAAKLGLDWSKKITESPLIVLEKYYNIPFGKLRHFTFEHIA